MTRFWHGLSAGPLQPSCASLKTSTGVLRSPSSSGESTFMSPIFEACGHAAGRTESAANWSGVQTVKPGPEAAAGESATPLGSTAVMLL